MSASLQTFRTIHCVHTFGKVSPHTEGGHTPNPTHRSLPLQFSSKIDNACFTIDDMFQSLVQLTTLAGLSYRHVYCCNDTQTNGTSAFMQSELGLYARDNDLSKLCPMHLFGAVQVRMFSIKRPGMFSTTRRVWATSLWLPNKSVARVGFDCRLHGVVKLCFHMLHRLAFVEQV